jgi:hypothetical protein
LLNEGIEVNLGNSDFGKAMCPPIPGEPAPEQAEQISRAQNRPTPYNRLRVMMITTNPMRLFCQKPLPIPLNQSHTNQNTPTTNPSEQPPALQQPKPKATMGAYKGGTGNGGNNQTNLTT